MICIKDASKHFQKTQVLKQVNADFMDGQISGIVGRNGSGKTVLLKCILGLIKPDEGTITVSGRQIGKDDDFARDVGFIVNRPGFLPDLSGMGNLRYLASIRRKIANEQIKSAIVKVGLDPDDRKHVGKYSMGMRQRLGIAQAIMEDPDLLVLDEPMNGLDNAGVADMRRLFLDLKAQGKTILLASHNREDIDALCDHVYEMDAGHLVQKF